MGLPLFGNQMEQEIVCRSLLLPSAFITIFRYKRLMEDIRYFWSKRWIFKWFIFPKEIIVEEWELTLAGLSILGTGSAMRRKFTGGYVQSSAL